MKKIIWSESGEKSAQLKRHLQMKALKELLRGQQGMDFFTGWSIIMDYGLVFWRFNVKMWRLMLKSGGLMLKCLNVGFVSFKHSFWLHKMLTDGLEWCRLQVHLNELECREKVHFFL